MDPIKFKHAIELEKECSNFVEKITGFNEKINSLVEVLETHASRIGERKLKAIGLRIASENESEQRVRKLRALQALIAEKKDPGRLTFSTWELPATSTPNEPQQFFVRFTAK